MNLILRQSIILVTLVAYVLFVAWIEKSSKPSAKLIWETGPESRLSFSSSKYLDQNDNFESWLEPRSFICANSTKVDTRDGMYYILKHSMFISSDPIHRATGLVKVYHMPIAPMAKIKERKQRKIYENWELQFVDRLPGAIISSSLDKSRDLDPKTNSTYPRRLGFLYLVLSGESSSYHVRIYNIDSKINPLSESDLQSEIKKLESYNEESTKISDLAASKVCSSDIASSKFDHDLVFTDNKFDACVGKSNSRFEYVDYKLPGSTEINGFTIKNDKIVYSRKGDIFYFRIAKPTSNTKYHLFKNNKELKSFPGAYIKPENKEFAQQLRLAILPSNRGSNLDLLVSEGWLDSVNYKFKVSLFQNYSNPADVDKTAPALVNNLLSSETEDWSVDRLVQYSLRVGKRYSSLNEFERGLISRLPITEQVSRTTICYFFISQVVLTIDTSWEMDSIGNSLQYQKLSSAVLTNPSLSNDGETTGISLDDSGKVLVISKLNGDLLVFGRKASLLAPYSNENISKGSETTKFAIPEYNPKKKVRDSMMSKTFPKRLPETPETLYTWNLLVQWSSPEPSDVWVDSENQIDTTAFFGTNGHYNNLIKIQPLLADKYPTQASVGSPSPYGEYFISLRVFLIEEQNKKTLASEETVSAAQSNTTNTPSSVQEATQLNSADTKIRIMAVKYDGTTKYLSLDDLVVDSNWISAYLNTRLEVLIPILIVALLFVHYESRCN